MPLSTIFQLYRGGQLIEYIFTHSVQNLIKISIKTQPEMDNDIINHNDLSPHCLITSGVMDSVLTSSVVDHRFQSRLGQTKDL